MPFTVRCTHSPLPQASAQYFSLSDLDLACARWFFLVGTWSGAVVAACCASVGWGINTHACLLRKLGC